MKYPDFVTLLSQRSGLPKKSVQSLMNVIPTALRTLSCGEHVITPLGTFTLKYQRSRSIVCPDGFTVVVVPEKVVVRLSPGHHLKVRPGAPDWDHIMGQETS